MRLDKFLKVARIIKRRTVANEACDTEHVEVNGRRAKASYDVKSGDVITIKPVVYSENADDDSVYRAYKKKMSKGITLKIKNIN